MNPCFSYSICGRNYKKMKTTQSGRCCFSSLGLRAMFIVPPADRMEKNTSAAPKTLASRHNGDPFIPQTPRYHTAVRFVGFEEGLNWTSMMLRDDSIWTTGDFWPNHKNLILIVLSFWIWKICYLPKMILLGSMSGMESFANSLTKKNGCMISPAIRRVKIINKWP